MQQITMRGSAAEIRWSYHRAADLGAWSIDGWHLSATVVASDPFRLSQQPLSFVVVRPNGARWKWMLSEVTVTADTLRAQLHAEES